MSGARLLVIDDEAAIRRLLKISLEAEGYAFLEATDGQQGLVVASTQRPDLVILDLGLPDSEGITVLKRLREWSTMPVIVLTVRDSDAEKVALLDAGADDYLTKPFSVPELLARVRVALRHAGPAEDEAVIHSGRVEIDLAARSVSVAGKQIKLTATEYDILRLLARHAGRVVTQSQMLKEIWGPYAAEQTQYLRVYVGQLRKKLEKDPSRPELLLTEPGVGYRFALKG
jgi:two-component system, OmpR family, KDP operon response regulator KdpE